MPMAVNRGRRTTDDHAWRQEYRRKERKGKETWKGNWTRGRERREIKKKREHLGRNITFDLTSNQKIVRCAKQTRTNFFFFLSSFFYFFFYLIPNVYFFFLFFFLFFTIAKLQVLQNENLCNHGYRCLFTSVVFQKRKIAIEIKEALWLTEWISAQSFFFFSLFPTNGKF